MDDADGFVSLLLWCGLAACFVAAVLYGRAWLKIPFHRSCKLRAEKLTGKSTDKANIVGYLCRRWAAVSGKKPSILPVGDFLKAAEWGNLAAVRRAVDKGMDVNATRAPGGRTALMKASQNGRVDVVKFLLQRGANVDAVGGKSGKTALIRASENGHWEIIELLIYAGASIDARSEAHGKTALMEAIQGGNHAAALLLMDAGADIHVRDFDGRTAEEIGNKIGGTGLLALIRKREGGFSAYGGNSEQQSCDRDDDECYAILGCNKTDSKEHVREQYLALVKQFHPDTVQAKGLPEPFARFAAEQYLLVQEAYRDIMKKG